jgi:membrane protein DedA with SNARE-associated domain
MEVPLQFREKRMRIRNADSTAETLPEVREGSLIGYFRHMSWHGFAMLLRFALDAAATGLLLLAVAPIVPLAVAAPLPVLLASSQKLPFVVFFVLAMLRTLLSDYVAYRLGNHGVKYRIAQKPPCGSLLLAWLTRPFRSLTKLLTRLLMNANHWLVLLVLFVLRLLAVPGTSIANPYVLAGARGMSVKHVACVNVVATGGCITLCYLLGEAFTSWLE